ncbi:MULTISPECIES: DsbA family protein [Mycolicibacterium]|uniref:DSBA oxidoreductase n=1 Tax=Mycolicibacterium vanbaalenii (strain DSM 7251 / JCM 13017 / BCRC 16820 / KCTC 9966 / NRRL B-24157 / PYR-1) TaxID=350058 RepID=A1TGM3_MYCVP|nr:MULTISPECIES: thioredoxin domain-containing protein [Mycolicibacterium]ABM16323.1 DSBA oxidoreductase [Mycolicibacterium vanbaalenii PYR-1]MCV7127652.1 thioredoxin domain-containing protein [Mycolicibacterium vanbaalenii PYR-1]UJL30487.1 thioredoxin domain-containing protein [Mycolicibacterium vanbaalenii]WND56416.1 thioredoxin domain-containing protein [Mycolicibacterium vanbaalenii]
MSGSRRESVVKDLVFIGGLLILAVALIVYLVMGSEEVSDAASQPMSPQVSAPESNAPGGQVDAVTALSVERRTTGDPLAQGDPAAPVVMVMFADYRCPFCAKFSRDTEPDLVERFVDQGVLRLEWRDMPIFGEQSMRAARAGRAAAEQGKFWEFNHEVFAMSPDRGHADLNEDALVGFAEKAGVPDIDKFAASMRGNEFDAAIDADLAQGSSIGVPSTPAFVINGEPVLGAQPTEEFVRVIDEAKDRT